MNKARCIKSQSQSAQHPSSSKRRFILSSLIGGLSIRLFADIAPSQKHRYPQVSQIQSDHVC